jgi:EAL domain-containing protein (putative c-di-GMP-specific phosphodiesterase class I)/CheY-like chemotaxis protein
MTRLLIIDDEADICDLIADVAETRGFSTQSVSDPGLVGAALAEFKPTAIMLDLMMPGTDGVELLRTFGDAIKGCAVVLMSGHDSRVLNSARRLGAAHGINVIGVQEKPIDVTTLRATLDSLAGATVKTEKKQAEVSGRDVKRDDIVVFYQPIVECGSGRVRGMEALARWQHPQHGIVAPDRFMAEMDEKAMDALAARIMEVTTRDLGILHKSGFAVTVSINMTAGNLIDLGVPDRLDELCRQHGVLPENMNVEVTEGEAMRDVKRAMDVLTRLRLRGFGVAIDDFGIGYSSLRELQRLPFSAMKIDKSFVMDMTESRDSQIIVNAIIDLGHNLGLKVVAEGVETAAVYTMLAEKRCDLAQGYLISKPLPFDALQAWLAGNKGVFTV